MNNDEPLPELSLARLGDALLLDAPHPTRALWQGRPARVSMQYVDVDEGHTLVGMARTIAREGGAPLSPVLLAAIDAEGRAIIVVEQGPGVSLGDLVAHVKKSTESEDVARFPLDVACRLALQMSSLTTWTPRMPDFVVTWEGRLCASPVPVLPGVRLAARFDDNMRYLSPEQVRGEPMDAARDSVYAAGVLLFELLTGAPPFRSDDNDNAFGTLSAIMQGEREPLLHRRPDLPEPLGDVVDALVTLDDKKRPATANVRAVLGARACNEDEAAQFLVGFLRDTFPRRRAADLAYWEDAGALDASTAPTWTIAAEPAPVTDLRAAWRMLSNRATKTD